MKWDDLPAAGDAEASLRRFRHCAQRGLLKHAVPAEYGGYGDRFADLIEAHEVLGKACMDTGLLLSINAHLWGSLFPILNFGTPEQKAYYLPKLVAGDMLGGHAITEPQAGSDLNAMAATALRSDAGFVLNGRKRFITNTPIADVLVVYARLEDKPSAFIVRREDGGTGFLDAPQVSGCKTATMGDLVLADCLIPSDRQLGKTGAGNLMVQQALELERAFVFAGICGLMARQLELVVAYSRERRVNGVHLGKNQAVGHKIADMKLRLDTAQLWVKECARLKDANKRITLASAETKLFAAEAFLQSCLDAVQIFGAEGLRDGGIMAALVADALAGRLFSGSSEIQKNIIAALLGTGEGYR